MEDKPNGIVEWMLVSLMKVVIYIMMFAPLIMGVIFGAAGLFVFLGTNGVFEINIVETSSDPYSERMGLMFSSVVFIMIGIITIIGYGAFLYKIFKKSKRLDDESFEKTENDVIEYK